MKRLFLIFTLCAGFAFHLKVSAQCSATIYASTTSVCSGDSVDLVVTTTNCGSNAQFLWSTGQNTQNIRVYPIDTFPTLINLMYTVTITSSSGTIVRSKQITVRPYPAVVITNNTQQLCNGSNTNIALSSLTPNTTFTWTASANNLSGVSNGGGPLISQSLVNMNDSNGIATYLITPANSGCVGTPKVTTVVLHQRPRLTVNNIATNICSGEQTNIELSSTFPGSTFSWTSSAFFVDGASVDSGTYIMDTLSTTQFGAGYVDYFINANHYGCQSATFQTSVTVKPIPAINFSTLNPQICNGDSIQINITSLPQGASINWTVSSSNVSGAYNGSGNLISQTLTASNPPALVNYSVNATLDGCIANPVLNTVSIKKTPEIFFTPANPEICSGSSPNVHLSSSPPGALFFWHPLSSNVTGGSDGNGNIINQLLTNTGLTPESIIYNITGQSGGCTSAVTPISVLVKPIPEVLINPDTSFMCSGNSTNIQLSSSPAGAFLSWNAFSNNLNGYSNGTGNVIAQTLSTTSDTGSVTYIIMPVLNQCQGTSAQAVVYVNSCLDIEGNNDPQSEISLYPNPTNEESVLKFLFKQHSTISIVIFNQTGQKIFDTTYQQYDEYSKHVINTSAYDNGIYTVVIFANQTRYTRRLMVIH